MKLATVNPRLDVDVDSLLPKDVSLSLEFIYFLQASEANYVIYRCVCI